MTALTLFIILITVVAVYSIWVEPNLLRVAHLELCFPDLPRSFDGFHIVHITDVHCLLPGRREAAAALRISELSPDALLCTGDLFNDGRLSRATAEWFENLNRGRNTYLVLGNHDATYRIARSVVQECLRTMGVEVLRNETVALRKGQEVIRLIGVDDPRRGLDDLALCADGRRETGFTVLLAHSPEIHYQLHKYPVDLTLSGHTHGGQMCLPFVGPIYTNVRDTPRRLCSGLTWLDNSKAFYVSRGLGLSSFAVRLFCPPEIASITLRRGSRDSQEC
ncbi:MAG: hypothetical protein AUJ92_06540 [Armatimonadetes bacterium CG2_30_59_28]|nr:metallophosphoesterase [Armatimonadota bacterium]OIO96260.1 MAG: hypothetical protein AUJ92_06540 [Armatimonadetes bacterium CG2_30_59_28]PIU64666.1 MAG: hypothetical protein COS85_11600 [Armatimonadetes bacterium CG07_land_8_20_14_0_80_59_28]PIX40319.1 MAG: hypothetical protein COZ56_15025 [Armatimonadetes bacterium CG_4_8_14_3_um_filter_58_9]PIY48394.1 MAG: hypothetical protein COZ05_03315 [Armatimonadetes bacterium CG_4_10_14_3_um_filter_59_10]